MKIIGCDFHPGYQQIAMLDLVTGEMVEKALSHERKEEVRAFYAGLEGSVRVGIEASGQSQWFERMLAELGQQVWIGDAAKIHASCERKQKTDRRDAELLLRLLAEDRFPRIWVPTAAERDERQLLLHRHKLVRMRTQVKNQLQALALNQVCNGSGSCGARREESSWNCCRCCPGPAGGGQSCCSYSMGWRRRSQN
jgi:transposase